jgi:hypothetical protein
MTTHCYIPILGKRIRVTQLDECGNPPAPTTADAWVATDGFTTLTLSSQVEDGAEILTRNASGHLVVNEKLSANFKRFNVDIDFVGVNPALLTMMSNANSYADYNSDAAGFTVPEGVINKTFALEIWTGLSGQACPPGGGSPGGYLLLPFVHAGTLGDIAITGDKDVSFTLKSGYTKGGNVWGAGPFKVVYGVDGVTESVLPSEIDSLDHLLMLDTLLAPPPSACDPSPMPPMNANLATAGTPGTWGPFQSTAPSTYTQANTWAVAASPSTAWTTGQYVQGTTAGDTGKMNWTGATWATGAHA